LAIIINTDKCTGCGRCVETCPAEAIAINESIKKAVVDISKCTECGICIERCKKNAISLDEINIKQSMHEAGFDPEANMKGMGRGSGQAMGRGISKGMGRGSGQDIGAGRYGDMQKNGVIGQCLCPNCRFPEPHIARLPCANIKCPACGVPMVKS